MSQAASPNARCRAAGSCALAVAALALGCALYAWMASPDDFAPLISRPHVPPSTRPCCSPRPAPARGSGGAGSEAFARIAIVTDVGCWERPSESAHAQIELVELLASLGARPSVLALMLACGDAGLRPWARAAPAEPSASRIGGRAAEQSEGLRARLAAVRGARVHWLRLDEPSHAPASLQLSRATASFLAAAGGRFERVLFPDGGGLALLAAMAPASALRPRVSVLALGPLLWRRQWCLSPVASAAELEAADREEQLPRILGHQHAANAERARTGEAPDGAGARGPDELLVFSAELGEWMGRRAQLPHSALLHAPGLPLSASGAPGARRALSVDTGGVTRTAAGGAIGGSPGCAVLAFADWGSAAELTLLSRALRTAAAELARGRGAGAAQPPALQLVARRAALDCSGGARGEGEAAAARARERLLRWAGSAAGWPGPWHEVGPAGQDGACASAIAHFAGAVAFFPAALGGGRAPPELLGCVESGAWLVASDVAGMRAALSPRSWAGCLAQPRAQPLAAALVAAVRAAGARAAGLEGGARPPLPSLAAEERAGWWQAWAQADAAELSARAAAHGEARPSAAGGAAGAHAARFAVLLAHCAPAREEGQAEGGARLAEAVRLLGRALAAEAQEGRGADSAEGPAREGALDGGARAEGCSGARACDWRVLCVGGRADQWRAALGTAAPAGVPAQRALSQPEWPERLASAPALLGARAGVAWLWVGGEEGGEEGAEEGAEEGEAPHGRGSSAGACGSLGSVDRALRAAQSEWLLILEHSALLPATPQALAELGRAAQAAPAGVAAIAPAVRECDEGSWQDTPGRCSLCIPSGAAANAAALSNVLSCGALLMRTDALRGALAQLGPRARLPASAWGWHLLSASILNGSLVHVPHKVAFERACARQAAGGGPAGSSRCSGGAPRLLPAAYGALGPSEGWLASAARLAQERQLAVECAS